MVVSLGGSHTDTLTKTEGQSVTDTISIGWNTSNSFGHGGASEGDSRGQSRSRSRSLRR